jgi:hypothetical protein
MPTALFTERGFHVTGDVTRIGVPLRVDLQTGKIYSEEKKVSPFSVRLKYGNPTLRVEKTTKATLLIRTDFAEPFALHSNSGNGAFLS